MTIPTPIPGLVIRYGFLWSNELEAGADEAAKDRPCAIVVAAKAVDGEVRVIVAPITHSPPTDLADSIAVSSAVSRALGLDGERHWLRADELNRFTWPGYDLRPIPGRTAEYAYGMLPKALFERLRTLILERHQARLGRTQVRD